MNEIISRNDDEFEVFQKMDAERYATEERVQRIQMIREKKPHKAKLPDEKINYRLIQDWEVAEWIHQSVVEEKEVDPLVSLGKRKRTEKNYTESMSDNQYFKMLEKGLDPNNGEDLKRVRRNPNTAKAAADSSEDDSGSLEISASKDDKNGVEESKDAQGSAAKAE